MPRQMQSRFPGTCERCGKRFPEGTSILWFGRGHAEHAQCTDRVADLPRRQTREDTEYAIGAARADHIRSTRQLFGEEAAAAEEYAWDMKDPDGSW